MTRDILAEINMKELIFVFLAGLGLIANGSERLYENNFEKAALGTVPDGFLVLNGDFSVKEENGNKFLEAPGAPVDTYGVMVGPTEKEGWAIAAPNICNIQRPTLSHLCGRAQRRWRLQVAGESCQKNG